MITRLPIARLVSISLIVEVHSQELAPTVKDHLQSLVPMQCGLVMVDRLDPALAASGDAMQDTEKILLALVV